MKKIYTSLLLLFISLSTSFGFNDTTRYWKWAANAYLGTTNYVQAIHAAKDGSVYYTGQGQEITAQKRFGFIFGKLDSLGKDVWKSYYFGETDGSHKSIVVDDKNNLFITGNYKGQFIFLKDTLKAVNNGLGSFLLCLDATNGNFKWVKKPNFAGDNTLKIDHNGDLLLTCSPSGGAQTYDGNVLATLSNFSPWVTAKKYGYVTYNPEDGSIKNSCFGEHSIIGDVNTNVLDGREIRSLIVAPLTTAPFGSQIIERKLNLDTKLVTTTGKNTPIPNNLEILNTFYLKSKKEWVLFVNTKGLDLKIGTDVFPYLNLDVTKKDICIVKLDSNLKLMKHLFYASPLVVNEQVVNDTTIAFGFGIIKEGYVGADTIKSKEINRGYLLAKCNFDLENLEYYRMAVNENLRFGVNGWGTGMTFAAMDLDQKGNIFACAYHEKDILFPPFNTVAANKSWKHLSVIAKSGSIKDTILGTQSKIEKSNLKLFAYPNPVVNQLRVAFDSSDIISLSVFDLEGKLVAFEENKNSVIVSNLPKGIYILKVLTSEGTSTQKIVKE